MGKQITSIGLAVLISAALVLAGCSSGGVSHTTSDTEPTTTDGTAAVVGTLSVTAGSSLTKAMTDMATAFRASVPEVDDVELTFGSATVLAQQVRDGATTDVFASPDELMMASLNSEGALDGDPRPFASNEMAIVVNKGAADGITSVADLAGVKRVALCSELTPCGGFTYRILGQAGTVIPERNVTRGEDARATLLKVLDGQADAAIVYLTDALYAADRLDTITIPEADNVNVSYSIAVTASSGNKTAAHDFVDFVLSDEGQRLLRELGFAPPR